MYKSINKNMQFKSIFDSLEYYLFIMFGDWINWLYKKVKKKTRVRSITIIVCDLKQSSEK